MGLTITVTGALAQVLGVGIDLWTHSADPTLAAREGPFTLSNVGHAYFAAGLCLVIVGSALAAFGPRLYARRDVPAGRSRRMVQLLTPPLLLAALAAGVWGGTTWGQGSAAAHSHSDAQAATNGEHAHAGAVTTPAPLEALAASDLTSQLRAARSAATRYATVAAAEAAGYRRITAYTQRMGAHYFAPQFAASFDPGAPSMLLFDGVRSDSRLTALSYYVESAAPPDGFAGNLDHWHNHAIPACVGAGANSLTRDGGVLSRSACERDGGLYFNGQATWMLHAWVADGVPNPIGLFNETNPTLP
jgi:hypothetical protein